MQTVQHYPTGAIWKWRLASEWICYDMETSEIIESKHRARFSHVNISIGEWQYTIDFRAMTQTNCTTQNSRQVLRDVQESAYWVWEAEPEQFKRIEPSVEPYIERKFQSGELANPFMWIDASNVICSIDLNSMVLERGDSPQCRINRIIVEPAVYENITESRTKANPDIMQRLNINCIRNENHNQNVYNEGGSSVQGTTTETSTSSNRRHPSGTEQSGEVPEAGYSDKLPLLRFSRKEGRTAPHSRSPIASNIIRTCNLREYDVGEILEEGQIYCSGSQTGVDESAKRNVLKHVGSQDDDCAICLEQLTSGVVQLLRCPHYYHLQCIEEYLKHGQKSGIICPKCNAVQCPGLGPCPKGTMSWIAVSECMIEGVIQAGTIIILYHIVNGIQNYRHSNPRMPFDGTIRSAYLPYNNEGKLILELFKRSFQNGHTFTVGTSITTGRANTVIWNGIHHKTSIRGGASHYGYPDDNYFHRVLQELKEKGIEPYEEDLMGLDEESPLIHTTNEAQ